MFHALGDKSRRQIIGALSARGPCDAGTLVSHFDTSQPTISRHLLVLEKAGLVQRRVEGRRHVFTLEPAALNEADQWIQRHLSFWRNSLDQLGEYLDEMESES